MLNEFIDNDFIGVYVKEERLHNPCGFVSDYIKYSKDKWTKYILKLSHIIYIQEKNLNFLADA